MVSLIAVLTDRYSDQIHRPAGTQGIAGLTGLTKLLNGQFSFNGTAGSGLDPVHLRSLPPSHATPSKQRRPELGLKAGRRLGQGGCLPVNRESQV
ncbi:unnamed protein product [Lota lota]